VRRVEPSWIGTLGGIVAFVATLLLPILIGALLLMLAARIVTRIVIDEVRKDRQRRGPL
jgi:type IV secretory pathway TrbL component